MLLEVIADDNDVRTGIVGRQHGFGCSDTATNDEGASGSRTDGADRVRRDGILRSRTGLQVDGRFAH